MTHLAHSLHAPHFRRSHRRAAALRSTAIRAAVLAALLPVLSPADALTYTWVGGAIGTPTSWGNLLNWQSQQRPHSAADTVLLFPNSFIATVNDIADNFQFNQLSAFAAGVGNPTGSILGQSLAPSGANAQIAVGAGGSLVVNAALVGAGDWAKTGAGELSLGGINAGASGDITVAAGRLSATASGSLGTGAVAVSGGATLRTGGTQFFGGVSGAGTWLADGTVTLAPAAGERRFDGTVSGTAALVKAGAGRQVFTGTVALANAVSVGLGELALSGSAARFTGATALTINNTGKASLDGGAGWTMPGSLTVGGGTTLTSTAALSLAGGSTLNTLNSNVGQSLSDRGAVTLSGGSNWVSSGGLGIGIQGVGSVALTQAATASALRLTLGTQIGGQGTLTLDGGSTFTTTQFATIGAAGQGSLAIAGGSLLSNNGATVGDQTTGLGTLTLSDSTSGWTTGPLTIGSNGQGTVTATGGVIGSTSAMLGRAAGAVGNANLGAGAQWTLGSSLIVGNAGSGNASFVDGASLSSASASLGLLTGGVGTLTLDRGSLWTNNGTLVVGSAGRGTVTARGGSAFSSGATTVGVLRETGPAPGQSTVLLDGSLWTVNGELRIADAGVAAVTVTNGAELKSSTAVMARSTGSDSTLNLGGGAGFSRWNNAGSLVIGQAGLASVNLTGQAEMVSGNTVIGAGAGSRGALGMNGTGGAVPQWTVNGTLDVGGAGEGTVFITNGTVGTGAATIGAAPGGAGSVNLGGSGSTLARWGINGNLTVGSSDTGRIGGLLWLGQGAEVRSSGQLAIQANGQVMLRDGLLSVSSLGPNVGGRFDWIDGTLEVTGPDGVTLGSTAYLGSVLLLGAHQTLAVTNRLVVGSGTIVLSDQAQVRAGTLALGGGQIVGTAPLVLGSTSLQGTGYVGTAVTGGLADSSVTARGGTLIVGDPNSTSGFLTLGATNAEQNARLVLASARLITLGARSELGAGGVLQTFKGAYLGAGSELRASQGGTVFGSFINDGQVAGPASGTSDLTFNDNVNGGGAFSGRVRFLQHYSPSANAQVEELNLAPTATLLLGVPAGGVNAEEALTVTGQALLDGTLDLDFNAGYAPPSGGGQFVLINWRHFEGRFANFTVEGLTPGWTAALNYDADALRVSISAVPEPAAWLLMLTGLLAVRSAPRPRAGCLQA